MLSKIQVKNFRGLRNATIDGLKRVNIITGENGAGKTSLLEAAFLLGGAANAGLTLSLFSFRNDTTITPDSDRMFKGLFRYLDPTITVELTAEETARNGSSKKKRKLVIKPIISREEATGSTTPKKKISGVVYEFDGPSGRNTSSLQWTTREDSSSQGAKRVVSLKAETARNPDLTQGYFLSPRREVWEEAHKLLTDLTKANKVQEVVKHMRMIDSRLQNLLPLSEDGVNVIYADVGAPSLMPASLQGSGFGNVLQIVLDSFSSVDGMLMIDEVEDGLHHSVIDKLIRYLFFICNFNKLQIFITTHSEEILGRFASLSQSERFSDLGLFRVVSGETSEQVNSYTVEDLISSRETQLELR